MSTKIPLYIPMVIQLLARDTTHNYKVRRPLLGFYPSLLANWISNSTHDHKNERQHKLLCIVLKNFKNFVHARVCRSFWCIFLCSPNAFFIIVDYQGNRRASLPGRNQRKSESERKV